MCCYQLTDSSPTWLLHHVDHLGLVLDGEGVVDPAVVLISNLAVGQRETLVCRLGQLIAVGHLDQVEVAAVCARFLAGEGSTQHAVPAEEAGSGKPGKGPNVGPLRSSYGTHLCS